MQDARAQDLRRQLESLQLGLQITKQQFVIQHEHLARATVHLGKAIAAVG
jgi:hypothetical protein